MNSKDEFLKNLSQDEMEQLLAGISPAGHQIDSDITARIRERSMRRIRFEEEKNRNKSSDEKLEDIEIKSPSFETERWTPDQLNDKTTKQKQSQRRPLKKIMSARRLVAAVLVVAALGFFSPQVQAGLRKLVSFIPGIGVIERSTSEIFLIAKDLKILEGNEYIIGSPVITADGSAIGLTLQVGVTGYKKEDDSDKAGPYFENFEISINGKPFTSKSKPSGMLSESESETLYQVYFEATPANGDIIRFSNSSIGVVVEGTLTTIKSHETDGLASGMIGDVLVMTKSFRNNSSWELYMVALSDTVRPTSFVESYIFKDKLFFEMETGESYEVMLPTYYGTGFMPPLKLDAPYGRGALIIPSISYTTDDQASYTFKIPKKGETLRTTDSFDLAGFLVTVEKIYRNPDNDDEVTLELTWPQGQETLDNFRPDEAFSAAMGNGSMVLTLDTKFSLTGKKKVVFIEPEMTWHEKTTIPLELK